jgi:hypothetical protein
MKKQWTVAAFIAVSTSAIAACDMKKPSEGPSANYQAPVSALAAPANVRAICYDDAALSAYRVRMVQQEMTVGVLSCQGTDGKRSFEKQYGDFLTKFKDELASNAGELKAVAASKKANFDVLITEVANRTAQQPRSDNQFCSRFQKALDWSLSPKVTSLKQVPSPYDFGPDMKIFACPKS